MRGVTRNAEEHEALAQLVLAAVGVQNFPDLLHHFIGLHGGGGLHAPGEAEGAWLGVLGGLGGRGCAGRWRRGIKGVLVFVARQSLGTLLHLVCCAQHGSSVKNDERREAQTEK